MLMAWNEPGNSGRDPWNPPPGDNRNGPEGPDLDALLRRFQSLFGSRGPGASRPSQRNAIAWGLAAFIMLWAGSGFYTVDEQERAVVLRFGAYAGTASQGVRWHWPWPIEHIEKIRVTNIRAVSTRAVLLTADENIVDAEVTAQFRVSMPEQFAFNVDDPDKTLQQTLGSVVREVIGHATMDDVLRGARQAIGINIRERLQARLDRYGAGLLVTEVNLQSVEPPESVKGAFAEAIKAREDRARLLSDGDAYMKDRLPRAQAEADRQLAEAQAYRDQVIARAEGEAARFDAVLDQYHKAPKVTHDRLYLDAMTEILSKTGKLVVDVDRGTSNLNIPLDQLLHAHAVPGETLDAPPAPAVAAPAPQVHPPQSGNNAPPAQDSYRSRDRGSH